MNQVISKHMAENQQRRWSQRGANLLLQVRTKVLDEELRISFQLWYSGLNSAIDQRKKVT